MAWKYIGYIAGGLLILVLIGGVGFILVRRTEGYKADKQTFQTFEPHFFIGGCATYKTGNPGEIEKEKK